MSTLFVLILIVESIAVLGTAYNVFHPEVHLWPPPGRDSWQFKAFMIFDTVCTLGVPAMGILDRGSLGLGTPLSYTAGAAGLLAGCLVILWAFTTLGIHQSLGLKGRLVTWGPYRYSRNPQYLGYILVLIGLVLITDSANALAAGSLVVLWLLLAPFCEEPWLREQFGEDYVEYCERVPRFL